MAMAQYYIAICRESDKAVIHILNNRRNMCKHYTYLGSYIGIYETKNIAEAMSLLFNCPWLVSC